MVLLQTEIPIDSAKLMEEAIKATEIFEAFRFGLIVCIAMITIMTLFVIALWWDSRKLPSKLFDLFLGVNAKITEHDGAIASVKESHIELKTTVHGHGVILTEHAKGLAELKGHITNQGNHKIQ